MVNENFEHGWARVSLPKYRLRPNSAAGLLRKGDIVKPNFANTKARRDHPPGVILKIDGDTALVRWKKELTEQRFKLRLLVKVKG